MSVPRPLPLWKIVPVFLVTVAMVPLIRSLPRWHDAPPRTLMELTKLLSRETPSLNVVSLREDYPEFGIYICTQPQPREQLTTLFRNSKVVGVSRHGKWQGIVFCERMAEHFKIEEGELQSWGDYGMRIGPLLFFGDPHLLRRIHTLILERQEK